MKDFTPGKPKRITILRAKGRTIQSLHSVNFKNNNNKKFHQNPTNHKLMSCFKQKINKITVNN